MSISVILAHPEPGSFNHAIAATCVEALERNHHQVNFHDLYQEDFDSHLPAEELMRDAPLPPLVRRHCDEITGASGIIIVHPNWWGAPPAILKGWVDRVLRPGVAYEFVDGDSGEGVPNGLLTARRAIVLNTSNTTPERERNVFGDPIELIWRNCIFGLCGIDNFYRRNFDVIVTSTDTQRKTWLAEVEGIIEQRFANASKEPE